MTSSKTSADVSRSFARRACALFWLKLVGSTVAISVFFVAYFYVMNYPAFTIYEMPMLGLDRWMPVLPWSAWIYFSLWVYICMPSSLMIRANELGYYLMGAAILSLVGISFFYFLPTVVPSWGIDWSQYPMLNFLKNSDASGNACPSLHVAFSIYAAAWLSRVLATLNARRIWNVGNWVWCVLILISTMTTKQHVFIDVVCGGVLGVAVFGINNWLARKAHFTAFKSSCSIEK